MSGLGLWRVLLGLTLFCCLQCELLICIAEPDNSPAMSVVRGLVGQYPTIAAKVFVGEWVEGTMGFQLCLNCVLLDSFIFGFK